MKHRLPAAFIILLAALFTWTGTIPAASGQKKKNAQKEAKSTESMAGAILSLVNEFRKESELPPLLMDTRISEAAYRHSRNMAEGKVSFGHAGFDKRVGDLLKELAPAYGGAENVAFSPMGAGSVVKGWINSSGHRTNMEGDYNYTGIGIAEGKNGYRYITMIYIKKK